MRSKWLTRCMSLVALVLIVFTLSPVSAQSIPKRFIGNAVATQLLVIGRATVSSIFSLTPATGIVVTMNSTITPLGTYQPISSAGTVNTSSITVGTAGDRLTLENTSATSIVISDTGTLKLTGNITLGQFDTLDMISDGTNWIMLGTANN